MLHRAPWSDHAYVEVVLLFGLYPAGLFVTISGTSINLASPQKTQPNPAHEPCSCLTPPLAPVTVSGASINLVHSKKTFVRSHNPAGLRHVSGASINLVHSKKTRGQSLGVIGGSRGQFCRGFLV